MKTASRILLAFLASLCCVMAHAQPPAAAISGQVINQYGQPLPGATVRVCSVTATDSGDGCTPTATIYQDYGLSVPAGNPYAADQYGNYVVYAPALAAPNLYQVQVSPATGITWTYVVNGPYCSLSGCTFTGPVTATIFNATTSPYFEINGVQITSAALSDGSNLAKLNAANVFTGSPQTAPTFNASSFNGDIFNATTRYDVNGSQIASANLADGSNLAKLNASNTFTGATNTFLGVAGTVINATTGFRLAGTAPLDHILVGNGTSYVDSATIPASAIGGLYYQTVKFVGSLFTQRPILDFEVPLSVTDDVGNNSTNIGLAASGVTAGSYTCASVTLDIYGRTTAASSGTCAVAERVCTTGTTWTCYQVLANGTIEEWGKAGPVPTGMDSGTVAISFPTAFTTTDHLEITTSPTGCAGNSGCVGDWMQATNPIESSITTAGFTAYTGTGVTPGGGGSNLTATFYIFWHALGD